MPRGDRTGPEGMGPMTGRAGGFCTGFGVPGCAQAPAGRGFGMGFARAGGLAGRGWSGGGYGRRNRFYATGTPGWMRIGGYAPPYGDPAAFQQPAPEMEKQALKTQAEALQAELALIQRRLSAMESEKSSQ